MSDFFDKSFADNPVGVDIQRSKFMRNFTHKTTFKEGDLVPVFFDEVLPGDTFSLDSSFLCRMATPIFPVLDDAFLDLYFFFVPNRIVWEHWKEFCGENTSAPWTQTTEYLIPQIKFDSQQGTNKLYGATNYSVMNYFGIPSVLGVGSDAGADLTVSDLPNRAYRLIWNEFFRDQNLQTPVFVPLDDSDRSFVKADDETNYGGYPLKVSKFHDYFTSCLPQPQKGPAVTLSLGDLAPVVGGPEHDIQPTSENGMKLRFFNSSTSSGTVYSNLSVRYDSPGSGYDPVTGDAFVGSNDAGDVGVPVSTIFANQYADLSQATGVTVNALRQAFAIQRLYEKDARGGTRYRELLKAHFGVTSPDARVQVPEYLGGTRVPINMDQVLQTSSTDSTSPQGNTSGYSKTTSVNSLFTSSFVEHGMLIGLACVRVRHSYSQGVERYWSRKRRFDFYYPGLANIGEQAVLRKEIYATGNPDEDDQAFGYQEAWADYRYKPNRLSGAFCPDVADQSSSLADAWTYADFYSSAPLLSEDWIKEGEDNIRKTLAVQEVEQPQFIADFAFKCACVRPMPLYSIPGLIDHN